MWRTAAAGLLFGGLVVGCTSFDTGPETGGMKPNYGPVHGPPSVPGMQGPGGTKVPMTAPYSYAPPGSQWMAQQMMANSLPMNMMQINRGGPMPGGPGMPQMPMPPGGLLTPPGLPFAPGGPPAGPGPGGIAPTSFQGGPGGIMTANIPPGMMMPGGGIMQAQYAPASGVRFPAPRTQVRFTRPTGMKVYWFAVGPDGKPGYSSTPIETPGRYNFGQSAIYRLKLGNIEGRPGLELYPTMEVVPCNPKTDSFLAHNAVPVDFTPEDFKQVVEGNYITKVIYLPDPQYQDAAGTGIDEILSTRLEPGQDPVQEALKRGSILLVIRMGNVDQEAPNTPPLASPGPAAMHGMPPGFGGHFPPGPVPQLLQVPIFGQPNAVPQPGPHIPMVPPAFPGMAAPPSGAHVPPPGAAAPSPSTPPNTSALPPGVIPGPLFGAPQSTPSTPGAPAVGPAPVLPAGPLAPPAAPTLPGLNEAGKASVAPTGASTGEPNRPVAPERLPRTADAPGAPVPPPALPPLPSAPQQP
jgi:hypothetical protein